MTFHESTERLSELKNANFKAKHHFLNTINLEVVTFNSNSNLTFIAINLHSKVDSKVQQNNKR